MRMFRLVSLLVCVYSLYEDQVGLYDWHKKQLGKTSEIWLMSRGRSLFLSERGVLSLLKPSGEIEWRKIVNVLDSNVTATASLTEIFTYASGVLSAWTVDEGQIIWTRPVPVCSQLLIARQGLVDILIALHEREIEIFSMSDGETMKKIELGRLEKIIEKNNEFLVVLGENFTIWKIYLKTWTTEKIEGTSNGKVFCSKETCVSIGNSVANVYQNGELKEIDWGHKGVDHILDKYFALEGGDLIEIINFVPVVRKSLKKHVGSSNSPIWIEHSDSGLTVQHIDSQPIQVQGTSGMPEVLKFWGYYSEKGEILGFALLADYRVICFKGPTIRWVREEGLAHISSLYFIELPSKEIHAHNQYFAYVKDHNSWSDVLNNFLLRVQSQINKPELQLDLLEKDNFSFKKLIVITSDSGYLMAIQSLTSQIVWRLYVGKVLSVVQINSEEMLVVSIGNEKKTILRYVDVIQGNVISMKTLEYQVVDVITAGLEEDISIYLVDEALAVHLITSHSHADLYYYVLNSAENTLEGYKYTSAGKNKIWGMQISKNEVISSYITNKSGKIHQPAIATGTSRLIYKYADENLFAISTQKGQDFYIYIINSISGHIIYKLHQDGVSGTPHMSFHEHKLFAHYWNTRFERFEILSIELFKSNVDDSAGDVLKKYYSGKFSVEYTSMFTPEVNVFTQTYVFPHGVKDMKMTTTLQGITKPSLVMILDSNQVYLLDTQFLSPRRRLEDSVEEGLFDDPSLPVYKPSLPWSGTNIATYYLQLEGLQRLETADTSLESTSVVVAYGLDLFVARVMPEKGFDLLAEDFSKSAILLTVIGLLLLNIIVQRWFAIKNAKEKFNT